MHKFEGSTSIAHCRHDASCNSLHIKFHSGDKEHEFKDVPKDVFEQFKKCDSPGKFFHQHIRGKYET